jgi:hypothetical protein
LEFNQSCLDKPPGTLLKKGVAWGRKVEIYHELQ